jgi:hypothetical protein
MRHPAIAESDRLHGSRWQEHQSVVRTYLHAAGSGDLSFYSAEDLVLASDTMTPVADAHKEIWVPPKLVIEIREHCLSAKARAAHPLPQVPRVRVRCAIDESCRKGCRDSCRIGCRGSSERDSLDLPAWHEKLAGIAWKV